MGYPFKFLGCSWH